MLKAHIKHHTHAIILMNKYRTPTILDFFSNLRTRIYWQQSVERNHLTSSQKFNMSTSFHVGSLQAFITLGGFPSSLVSISVSSFYEQQVPDAS